MATLRDIRRRISSVKSTQQITRAMKMVAAAKLRRAQEKILKARPYAYELRNVIGHLANIVDHDAHPLLSVREVQSVGFVVVTSDRGLCGAFNINIIRRATEQIKAAQAEGKSAKLILVGKKARDYFRRRDYEIIAEHIDLFNKLDFSHAQALAGDITRFYTQGEVDLVSVIYNEFKSAVQQNLTVEQLLPIEPKSIEGSTLKFNYIYEPSPDTIINVLLPRQINIQTWRILLETSSAEHGARMTAMEVATENAQEMITDLTLHYNRVRQASITKEILEIIGGAEALKTQ
ncbi:ATP synthase F1 subunit gamma [candidate division KSB1 bacterium]|nr:ATP synthase F1 subunit gamma [candidate division KSB1 bacterium]